MMRRGDTVVEVTIAFVIFSLVAVLTLVSMNRGIATAEASLETTLIREQIDAQAEMMRYARNANLPAWQTIKRTAVSSSGFDASGDGTVENNGTRECPSRPPAASFVMDASGNTVRATPLNLRNYRQATVNARVNLTTDGAFSSEGISLVPVRISATMIDVYIRACWYPPADDGASVIQTTVRLYET